MRRDRLLQREAQVVLPAPRRRVHQDADAHQPFRRGRERLGEPARHHALRQQLLRDRDVPKRAMRRPAPDAEIAQAARAVLEVGLEQEDRVAEAAVALLLLGAQAGHEVLRRRLGDPRPEGGQELVRQRLVARHEARVEKRGRGRQVVGGQRQRLVVGAHGVARVDLRVPERIEDRLRQLLHLVAGRLGAQHQQVEVRERRELGAAEAAGREDRHRRPALRHLAPGDVDDDRIDLARKRPRRIDAARRPRLHAPRARRRLAPGRLRDTSAIVEDYQTPVRVRRCGNQDALVA